MRAATMPLIEGLLYAFSGGLKLYTDAFIDYLQGAGCWRQSESDFKAEYLLDWQKLAVFKSHNFAYLLACKLQPFVKFQSIRVILCCKK